MSLIIAWQLKNRKVLIIGGGEVASGRIDAVLLAGATVTLIAPEIHPAIPKDKVTVYERQFELNDITEEYSMVMSAVDDRDVSRQIYTRCRELKIPVNVADMPPECDFYFGSMINRGSLQIMVSTNGNAPRLAKRVREEIESHVDELGVDKAIDTMGVLRQKLRMKTVPQDDPEKGYTVDTIRKRMKWISDLCDDMTFRQIASLTDAEIELIVDKYPEPLRWEEVRPTVPKLQDLTLD